MDYNISEVFDLIASRRTLRPNQYSTRKVCREIVEKMIQAACWAPNHGNTEPWHFQVFMEQAAKQFARDHAEMYKASKAKEAYNHREYQKIIDTYSASTAIVAITMKRQKTEKILEIEEVEAVACAVQNMCLMARAYGVGTFWSTGGMTYSKPMKRYLKLGEKDKCLGFLLMGYPKDDWTEGKRTFWKLSADFKEADVSDTSSA